MTYWTPERIIDFAAACRRNAGLSTHAYTDPRVPYDGCDCGACWTARDQFEAEQASAQNR